MARNRHKRLTVTLPSEVSALSVISMLCDAAKQPEEDGTVVFTLVLPKSGDDCLMVAVDGCGIQSTSCKVREG